MVQGEDEEDETRVSPLKSVVFFFLKPDEYWKKKIRKNNFL